MTQSPVGSRDSIRRYYDKNTEIFLRFGRENETYTIHRALWLNGIQNTTDALNATNALLRDEFQTWRAEHPQTPKPRLLDLGCGVGGTLFYLLDRAQDGHGVGITLSAVQAELGRARATQINLAARALIVQADFQAIPAAREFDFVYSIEAFVHATDPEMYLSQAARVLHRGGRLIVCDDFRAARTHWTDSELAWLDTFQVGWHVPLLQSVAQVQHMAEHAGLTLTTNRTLMPFLKLRALPDRIARLVRGAGNQLPFQHPLLPSMLGSMALQQCLQLGLIEYRWLVFAKP